MGIVNLPLMRALALSISEQKLSALFSVRSAVASGSLVTI